MKLSEIISLCTKVLLPIFAPSISILVITMIFPKGINYALNLIEIHKLRTLILITLIASVACIELVYLITYKSKLKLKLKFGAYWDKELNPYCPICEKPLKRITESEQEYYYDLYCYICEKHICLYNDKEFLTFSEAKKLLKK